MVSKVGGSGTTPKIGGFPSAAELKKLYAAQATKAIAAGAKPTTPPKGIEKYPSVNITPKGEMGVSQQVYTYKGELYLKSTPVVPNAKSTWTDIGGQPMF